MSNKDYTTSDSESDSLSVSDNKSKEGQLSSSDQKYNSKFYIDKFHWKYIDRSGESKEIKAYYNPDLFLKQALMAQCHRLKINIEEYSIEDINGKLISLTEDDKMDSAPGRTLIMRQNSVNSSNLSSSSPKSKPNTSDSISPLSSSSNKLRFLPGKIRRPISLNLFEDTYLPVEDDNISFNDLLDKVILEPETEYGKFFFLIYTTITTPYKFLEAVIEKFKSEQDIEIKKKFIDTVGVWMTSNYTDFVSDPKVVSLFEQWCDWVQENNSDLMPLLIPLQNKRTCPTLSTVLKVALPDYEPIVPEIPFTFMEIDSLEFARQLTIIDAKMFTEIQPQELLNQAWMKKKKYAPNVDKITKRFNIVSSWVQTEILTKTKIGKRVQTIEKFIDICEHLRHLNNFNGLFEIGSAIESSSIIRLKNTSDRLSNMWFQKWEKLKVMIQGHNVLRAELSKTEKAVPYLGMFLTDLIFIDEGNPNTKEGLVNMKKRAMIAKTINRLQFYQKNVPVFIPVPVIQEYLENLSPITDESKFWTLSNYLEPKPGTIAGELPEDLKELLKRTPPPKLSGKKVHRAISTKSTSWAKIQKREKPLQVSESLEAIAMRHKDQIQKTHDQVKTDLTAIFTEFRDQLQKMNNLVDKVQETTLNELKNQCNTAITGINLLVEEMDNLPLRSSQATNLQKVYDNPDMVPPGAYLPTLVEWVWNNDQGGFSSFDTQTSLIIETAYSQDRNGECKLTHGFYGRSPGGYVVDFKKMLQIKVETGFARIIQRRIAWVPMAEHKKMKFDLETKVQSLEQKLQSLEQQQETGVAKNKTKSNFTFFREKEK